jgi:hypothetical protein
LILDIIFPKDSSFDPDRWPNPLTILPPKKSKSSEDGSHHIIERESLRSSSFLGMALEQGDWL